MAEHPRPGSGNTPAFLPAAFCRYFGRLPVAFPRKDTMVLPQRQGLYDPENERDACGVGFVAHIKNQKSHAIIEQGLKILENLEHRGATGYDPCWATAPAS
jgi:hypothetical protein